MTKQFRVYNLYPKLIGKMDDWIGHFDRIKAMNFDWIYLNPINAPGFSGSDYSVKDHYLYHPLFVTGEMDFSDLPSQRQQGNKLFKKVCAEAAKSGLGIMFDLVVNHTAIDCELVTSHPDWYMRHPDGSIKKPGTKLPDGTWLEWGDLADIDNEASPDKAALWQYWLDMALFYCDLGVRGFRCDAAYMVPAELWAFLIHGVKAKYPGVVFMGETLGCEVHQVIEAAAAGFDLLMNNFRWWDFRADWFMKQYVQLADKYATLTFPENHDTVRTAAEYDGQPDLLVMRYALAAYFCTGVATTIGFEFGFQRKIDVVQTNPSWWEETGVDISERIAEINAIKGQYPILHEDNIPQILDLHDAQLFAFSRNSRDGTESILVIANIDRHSTHTVRIKGLHTLMAGQPQDISHGHRMEAVPDNFVYDLKPGDVKLLYTCR